MLAPVKQATEFSQGKRRNLVAVPQELPKV
jgi:hypothetical protein